jgi:hypothetical protein
MIAAFICVFSVAAFVQFFVSYCRSMLAYSATVALSDNVREFAKLQARSVAADDFDRFVQLLRLCPDLEDGKREVRAVGAYYSTLNVLSHAFRAALPDVANWAERERQNCSYFAAVVLDRRIAQSRDLCLTEVSASL